MRTVVIIMWAAILSLPVLAGAADDGVAQSERQFLEECSAYSQAGMRECLAKKASESQKALKQVEEEVSASLSKWDEDAKYVRLAKTKLAAANKALARYRDGQCAFAASLSGGAAGNSNEMGRLACVAALNGWRVERLRDAVAGMSMK